MLQTIRAGFNRRMRKTARPVVWKAYGAESIAVFAKETLTVLTELLVDGLLDHTILYIRHSQITGASVCFGDRYRAHWAGLVIARC